MSTRLSPQEHDQLEDATGHKHEWIDGAVRDVMGAPPLHNTITGNIAASLHSQFKDSPCQVSTSHQRVKVRSARAVVYPDAVVLCPPHEWDAEHRWALLNPRVIAEVPSPATAEHDRITKFDLYKSIASFTDYVLVWSDRRRVEHFARQDDGKWTQSVAARDNECVDIASINCRLCLDDVYERTKLPASIDLSLLLGDDEDAPST